MSDQSSGCYVIDSEYNIVNANETALHLYPQLKIGKKCYSCLMGLDGPCGPCPVANGVKGPASYKDPIRNITEIVDAVDISIEGHGLCHMLIFSTVENEASFAATLPTSAEELKNLALIKGLTSEYYDVFTIRIKDSSLLLYRLKGKALTPDSMYGGSMSYDEQMEAYIQKYVHPQDQEMMRTSCRLENLINELKHNDSMILHYRVLHEGEEHYYFRRIVRIGDADTFENILVGIACEDEAVENREKQILLQNTLRKVEMNTMTGLLTREAFFIYGDQLLQKYTDLSFDFCFLKIDNLDSLGHQYGPIVKDQVVHTAGNVFRTYVNETTCIAYFGEGIFACFVESRDSEIFHEIMAAFEEQVRQESKIKNIIFKWSIYKGIDREVPMEAIYNRFAYIVNSVRSGIPKDCIELNQQMLERIDWELSVEKNFRKALQDGEFVVWYQPKYSVHSGEIVGAEALVRWITGKGEMIPPNRFIPVLENCGLINLLDEEVFRQVCAFQKELKEGKMPCLPISVNLSRASIFTRDIPKLYADIARSYGISNCMIPIEITESAAVRASMINEFVDALIQQGFSLHMDDFGAGYSSLASLQTLPFECLKIDKSLIDFIGKQSGESLLRHTIAFAKETGLKVVAEGVERKEQVAFLEEVGCDAIQGYYFSKPVDRERFWSMLEE